MKNEIRVYAGLTPAQHAVAKALADRRGLSMSALLRTLMLESAAREGITPDAYAYLEEESPMYKLEVGKPYIDGRTSWPEAVEFNWLDSGPELRLFLSRPTPVEIAQIRSGSAEFGLVYAERIVFLLAKFGSLEWMDAPFHLSKVPADRRPDLNLQFGPETRALLQVFLVDASNGILRAMRAVSLAPEFTRQLHMLIADQARDPMTSDQYNRAVDAAYRNHPVTELMLVKALAKSKGGT